MSTDTSWIQPGVAVVVEKDGETVYGRVLRIDPANNAPTMMALYLAEDGSHYTKPARVLRRHARQPTPEELDVIDRRVPEGDGVARRMRRTRKKREAAGEGGERESPRGMVGEPEHRAGPSTRRRERAEGDRRSHHQQTIDELAVKAREFARQARACLEAARALAGLWEVEVDEEAFGVKEIRI